MKLVLMCSIKLLLNNVQYCNHFHSPLIIYNETYQFGSSKVRKTQGRLNIFQITQQAIILTWYVVVFKLRNQVTISGCPFKFLVVRTWLRSSFTAGAWYDNVQIHVQFIQNKFNIKYYYIRSKVNFAYRSMVVHQTTASVFLVVQQIFCLSGHMDNQNFERWYVAMSSKH